MTAIKLEESIEELCFLLSGGWNRPAKEGLGIALRAFAEAVRERCSCPCHKDQACYACKKETCWKPPEPKECGCKSHPCPNCAGGKYGHCSPAALPDEVKEKIDEIMKAQYQGFNIVNKKPDLYALAHLCLSLRKP